MDISSLSAALALLPAALAGLAMGLATGKAVDAVARQPEANSKISALMLLGMALTESNSARVMSPWVIMLCNTTLRRSKLFSGWLMGL